MSRHRDQWKDHKIFTTSLSHEKSPDFAPTEAKQEFYGPGTLGCTYELCAGIVDKNKTLKQIAMDEVQEETGQMFRWQYYWEPYIIANCHVYEWQTTVCIHE